VKGGGPALCSRTKPKGSKRSGLINRLRERAQKWTIALQFDSALHEIAPESLFFFPYEYMEMSMPRRSDGQAECMLPKSGGDGRFVPKIVSGGAAKAGSATTTSRRMNFRSA